MEGEVMGGWEWGDVEVSLLNFFNRPSRDGGSRNLRRLESPRGRGYHRDATPAH